jgi:hypothetical protein
MTYPPDKRLRALSPTRWPGRCCEAVSPDRDEHGGEAVPRKRKVPVSVVRHGRDFCLCLKGCKEGVAREAERVVVRHIDVMLDGSREVVECLEADDSGDCALWQMWKALREPGHVGRGN